ncbi:MAG: UDP-N-acetylglucosamine 1-carboxyvinyltransferase [Clostridia bacterium]|nr:UDP-N-acetylglucosamine 1-carboxyvinyltransferase [Clostridia bacterium]
MSEITIFGARPLFGNITPSGSKNAALPIIFAALAVSGVSVLYDLPDITDVRVALDIISDFGAKIERDGRRVTLDTRNVAYKKPDKKLTSRIRASSYLIGACLSRFGEFDLSEVGGCNFCNRPLDMHLYAAEKLGTKIEGERLSASRLSGADIKFNKISVGATINALIMASRAKGVTRIFGAAREPHVKNVIRYLRAAGAEICDSADALTVKGSILSGAEVKIIPDMIEAGTFLLLGPLTGGMVSVDIPKDAGLESFFEVLSDSGISISRNENIVSAWGEPFKKIRVSTSPHPGFPTDLQPQTAPLMARYHGGEIIENVWQDRFSYLNSLSAFGIKSDKIVGGRRINPSRIGAAECEAPDLRGGAAAVLSALVAEGKSKIKNTELIMRGYADIWAKLRSLGARIE